MGPGQTSGTEIPTVTPEIALSSSLTAEAVDLTSAFSPTPELTAPSTLPIDTETPVPQPTLPDEHQITGVYGHKQYFSLGCEAILFGG